MKHCTKCDLYKAFEEFGKHSKNSDGFRCWCKVCCKKYDKSIRTRKSQRQRERREANRDEVNRKQREFRKTDKGKALLARYEASDKGKESKRRTFKTYYDKNKVVLLAKQRTEERRRYYREKARIYSKQKHVQEYRKAWLKRPENKAKENLCRRRRYKKDPGKFKAKAAIRRTLVYQATPVWVDLEAILSIYRACPSGCEVDHIVPLKSDIVCGLHVPWNLQYLTDKENGTKSNKFDGTNDNNSWRKDL